MIQLRPDQLTVKHGVYDAWNGGARVACAVMPTGTGKSVVMSDIILDAHQLGARQCVIAHRKELVGQMSMHIARRGIQHTIIAPNDVIGQIVQEHRAEFNRSFHSPNANASVAGIDTIVSRLDRLADWGKQIDYWYGDEFHHFLRDNKWGKGVSLFTNARGLGVTATPARADGRGLGSHADGLADAMILGLSIRQSIEIGAITDYEIAIPQSDFEIDDDALTASGDYSRDKMKAASKRSHIVGDVVQEYARRCFGKRAICFATDVETSGDIAKRFNDVGIPAAAVSAETPSAVRNDMIRRFKEGKIWILVNVDLFGEGFDVPACEVVIMARPTASLGLYLQMCGRALRTAPGKLFGLIIDHVSNWKRHGLPDKWRDWTLDRREKRAKKKPDPDDIELTPCGGCSRPYELCHPVCPYCGWEPPLPEPRSRSIATVAGDLVLLDRDTLARMRAATVLESPASVAQRVGAAAGDLAAAGALKSAMARHAAQQRLSAAVAQWAGIQRAMGRDDRESYRRFYLATGVDVLSALALDRAGMDSLAETVEGWYSDK